MIRGIKDSFDLLTKYCEEEGYKGYDPYDGLNSTFFNAIPLLSKIRVVKLIWIQLFKRSPINLRKLTGVKKDYNSKALGLFLSGYSNLYKKTKDSKYLDKIDFIIEKLTFNLNSEWDGGYWGYNFDWQAKAFYQPKNTPVIVPISFIVEGLLDVFEITGRGELLNLAKKSCDFILKDLYRTYDENGDFAFSYSPLDKSVIFNASLLASRTLSRVYSFTHDKNLIETAKKSVSFCCKHQREDGSWSYGTASFHQWIDNFHTGYNLICISDYMKYSGDYNFEDHLNKGFDYYIHTFFTDEGISKYYHNSTYPIDIHCPAQLVITLSKLDRLYEFKKRANNVLAWTIKNMQSKKGYFYFQKNRIFTSKIPYMRWAQAWMFYAFSEYLLHFDN